MILVRIIGKFYFLFYTSLYFLQLICVTFIIRTFFFKSLFVLGNWIFQDLVKMRKSPKTCWSKTWAVQMTLVFNPGSATF